MAAEEELTLTNILELTVNAKKDMSAFFKCASERIKDVDVLVSNLDEMISKEESTSNKNTLLQYKSSLLQIKTDIQNEVESMKKEESNASSVIGAVSKAIKLNSGDIF